MSYKVKDLLESTGESNAYTLHKISHPDATARDLNKAAKSSNKDVVEKAINHKNATATTAGIAARSDDVNIAKMALLHKKFKHFRAFEDEAGNHHASDARFFANDKAKKELLKQGLIPKILVKGHENE